MEEIFRLALVVNTNHSKFTSNLMNVVVYILSEETNGMSVDQIREYADTRIHLTFTEEEIRSVIKEGIKTGKIDDYGKNKFVIGNKGMELLDSSVVSKFENVVDKFKTQYKLIEWETEEIFLLINKYVYQCLNGNINIILELLKKKNDFEKFNKNENNYSDEEKNIINLFIDWADEEKNEMLFKIISFSVDYCRLSVKQSSNSFRNFFKGKKFILDANIFYRLLGINNEEREKTISKFIAKCNEVGIELAYSNYTKQEVFDSLEYNIDKLKGVLSHVKASPNRVEKLMGYDYNLGLYRKYHDWAILSNGFEEFDDFQDYIKDQFYVQTRKYNIKLVQFEDAEEFAKEQFEEKKQKLIDIKNFDGKSSNKVSAEIDVQNVLNIRRLRGKNANGTAWNVNQFLISADQNLIKWATEVFRTDIPLVVLPSVWFSLILQLGGRSEDDYQAYVQFMKIRYKQTSKVNVSSILYNVTQISDDGVLQDKIIDNLIQTNKFENNELVEEEEIKISVNKAYQNVLSETQQTGFLQGVEEGKEQGINEGIKEGFAKGQKKARLEMELEKIEKDIEKKAKRTRIKNIAIDFLLFAIAIVLIVLQIKLKIVSYDTLNKWAIMATLLFGIFPISGVVGMLNKKFLPFDLLIIKGKVRRRREKEIQEIQNQLKKFE